MEESQENSRSGEMRNFGLLLLISLIVVLVVAFSRPFIFGKVVPAVLGEGAPTAATEAGDDDVTDEPASVEDIDPYPASEEGEDNASEEVEEVEEVEESPQSIPTVTHLVQQGDTLTSIAGRFDTSIEEIMAANGLVDPNQLRVGTTLLIPQPEE